MTLAEMLTILSGTYLSAHFFAAILLFDTRNIRDIIPKASRKHPEGWRLFIVADFMWQLLPSSSQAAPKLLPSCSQLPAGNKGGGGEHVKTDKKSVSYTCVASFFNPFILLLSVLTVPAALLRMRGISDSLMPIWKRIRKNML